MDDACLVTGIPKGIATITAATGSTLASARIAPVHPPPTACANERSLAWCHDAQFGDNGVVREWDGTPFRVDMVSNFPEFVTNADLRQLLAPTGRLADQIEDATRVPHCGDGRAHRGSVAASAGWNQRFGHYSQSYRFRERGQILVSPTDATARSSHAILFSAASLYGGISGTLRPCGVTAALDAPDGHHATAATTESVGYGAPLPYPRGSCTHASPLESSQF